MTTRVHVTGPLTPFKSLVRMIEENRISAIPIVDRQGSPLGLVSEADLLLKERRGELESDGSRLRAWLRRQDRAKADGVIASDLMTAPPITVPTGTPIAEAARLMQERRVRRLIVVNERGKIAGIVSRKDLLQVFLRSDDDIREEIADRIVPTMLPGVGTIEVDVQSDVVTLSGEVDRRTDSDILTRLCLEVDGVVDVVNRLTYRWDDTKHETPAF